jgi:hypothetical protein
MNNASNPGPVLAPSGGTKPANAALLFQIFALVLAVPAVGVGCICVYGLVTAVSPAEPENILSVLAAWVVSGSIGLLILAIGLFVRKGSRRLRRLCIVTSLLALSFPFITNLLFSKAKSTEERTEVIIQEGGVLTSQALTLKAKTESQKSPLLYAGGKVANPPPSILEVYTGPITYPEGFSVNVYMDSGNANRTTGIKDSNLIGNFALAADDRRRNDAGDRTVPFPIMVGANFYKLLQPEKPFSVILAPVGRAANDPDFRIPVRRIELTAFGGSWVYHFFRSLPR